jgi:hypothetical protein
MRSYEIERAHKAETLTCAWGRLVSLTNSGQEPKSTHAATLARE